MGCPSCYSLYIIFSINSLHSLLVKEAISFCHYYLSLQALLWFPLPISQLSLSRIPNPMEVKAGAEIPARLIDLFDIKHIGAIGRKSEKVEPFVDLVIRCQLKMYVSQLCTISPECVFFPTNSPPLHLSENYLSC